MKNLDEEIDALERPVWGNVNLKGFVYDNVNFAVFACDYIYFKDFYSLTIGVFIVLAIFWKYPFHIMFEISCDRIGN